MNGKWGCECGWSGTYPNYAGAVDIDGGYAACPKCGEAVVLNPGHPTNAKYMSAMLKAMGEEVRRDG